MDNKAMNDFIRGKQAPAQPEALNAQQLDRVAFYLEHGVTYADALQAVQSYQAPPSIAGNAGNGTGTKPPAYRLDMNDYLRLASGRVSEAAIAGKVLRNGR